MKVAPAQPTKVRIKMKLQSLEMAAPIATQKAPKVSKQDCTFTGPKRSSRVPRATRTKIVTATDPIPEYVMVSWQWVPGVQTHFGRISKSYAPVLFPFSSDAPTTLFLLPGQAQQSMILS